MSRVASIEPSGGPLTPTRVGVGDDPVRYETDHRLANSLQLAAIVLKHESRGLTDVAAARTALQNASLRLTAIGQLHRQLSHDSSNAEVDLAQFLEPVCRDVALSIGAIAEVRADGVVLPHDVATGIGVIVSELAMNAVKHGAQDGRTVILTVDAGIEPLHGLRMTLRDNGPGLPEGFEIGRSDGLGMKIVASTVERLGGAWQVLPGEGAAFEITLPLS